MMRLQSKFKQLNKKDEKAFIAYVPYGFPNLSQTVGICRTLEDAGVDIIELGIPFSDPLADGPIIQQATTKALLNGANLDSFFKTLKKLQNTLTVPLVIMTYYNPIYKFGLSKFFKKLKSCGVNASLVVDLPVEESGDYLKKARKFDIDTPFFITPTTSDKRIKSITRVPKGFIYYISVTGITGPRSLSYPQLARHIRSIKKQTKLPVCIGFGIHTYEQVAALGKFSDGVIVGSSIVRFIENNYKNKNFLSKLRKFAASLCKK